MCRALAPRSNRAPRSADPPSEESPATCGHIKGNAKKGCACAYCIWRRAVKLRKRDHDRGWVLHARLTEELREEVARNMGRRKFEELEKAMQIA